MNYLLLIFPIALLVALIWGAKVCKKGEYLEDNWNRDDSKYLQAVAAIGIILHHLSQLITNYGKIDKGPIVFMNDMGILFTSIFFLYSGYGLMVSYKNKEDYLKGFLYKRMLPVLIPFMLTNLIYVPFNGIGEYRITNFFAALTSILGITLINTNAWFVVEILILYLVFFFSFKYISDKKKSIGAITLFTVVLVVVSLLLGHDTTELNGHWFMGEWWYNTTMLFPMGLIIGMNRDRVTGFIKKKYLLTLTLSIICFLLTFAVEEVVLNAFGYYKATYTYNGYAEAALTLLSQIFACFAFVWMILVITVKVRFGNAVLKKLSVFSFEIYLVQDLFFVSYRDGYNLPEIVIYVLILALSIGAGYVLHWVCGLTMELIEKYRCGELQPSSEDCMEYRAVLKRKRSIIYFFAVFYILVAVGTVVGGVINVYNNTFGREKMIETELADIRNASVGDEVLFGHFDTDPMSDGDERIEWIVLEADDEKIVMLSRYVLFPNPYNRKHEVVSYDASGIAKLLRGEGLYELFYKSERKAMGADELTGDKVFLLSSKKAEEYFATNEDRRAYCTEIAKRWGTNIDSRDEHSYWWLYTDGEGVMANIVSSEGEILLENKEVNRPYGGVRPAIIVLK